jgi:hypothetical protein
MYLESEDRAHCACSHGYAIFQHEGQVSHFKDETLSVPTLDAEVPRMEVTDLGRPKEEAPEAPSAFGLGTTSIWHWQTCRNSQRLLCHVSFEWWREEVNTSLPRQESAIELLWNNWSWHSSLLGAAGA